MTFADLMSLLMCFFVLLLSFAEMDVVKFRQLAGSMNFAFGVQSKVAAEQIPKGTSVVAQEFSPGKPEPTVIKQIQQVTSEDWKEFLKRDESDSQKSEQEHDANARSETESEGESKSSAQALRIAEALADEIKSGLLTVEVREGKTIIRIEEKGSFPSGSDELKPSFSPVMEKISSILRSAYGSIQVSGHTDDVPIKTRRFRSNWELSSARSVTVLHELLKYQDLDQSRFTIEGLASSRPLDSNDTNEGRARNRRVEIAIEE